MFAQHHWPRWGRERIVDFLSKQRDLYGYIHDQTLRLLNKGLVAAEIAEVLELPPSLEREWHCRGYYGSLNHNVKAVYQRYLGWFDGNPAHLWPHPPQAVGGALRRARRRARRAARERASGISRTGTTGGSWRSSTTSCSPTPTNATARELQAQALEQLAFGAENGTWRNFFLMGARELRHGAAGTATAVSADVLRGLSTSQILDAIAIQIDGPRAGELQLAMHWRLPDAGEEFAVTLTNGVLTHRAGGARSEVDATVTVERAALNELLLGAATPEQLAASGRLSIDGDASLLAQLLGLLDPPDPGFAIVTP